MGSTFLKKVCCTAPQVPAPYVRVIGILGKLGFAAKAIVYSILGGLICKSAVSDELQNESPQGVFLLVAGFPVGQMWLAILASGVALYATWRIVEGFTGQGFTAGISPLANFFRFRLSPIVSGVVYLTYLIYVIKLFNQKETPSEELSLALPLVFFVALAFLIAFVTQMLQVLLGQFLDELKDSVLANKRLKLTLDIIGRIGFFGRACVFMLISVLFWKWLAGTLEEDEERKQTEPAISRALAVLTESVLGRVFLFVVGFCLIVYGIFALLCVQCRQFPTRSLARMKDRALASQLLGRATPHMRDPTVPAMPLPITESTEFATEPSMSNRLPLPPAREETQEDIHSRLERGEHNRLRSPLRVSIPDYR